MSGTVTGLDLDRLEELAEKATPGPWEAKVYRFPNMAGPKWPEVSGGRILRDGGTMLVTDQVHYADDAEFIAEFHNAVPSLLAAARAVQRVEALIAPVARMTAHEALETSSPAYFLAMSQFADQVRAALGTEQEGHTE